MGNLKKFLGINGLYKYGAEANGYDVAKFLAITFMVIDHLGYYFFPEIYFLRGLGRIAFPIFFFLIGYSKYFSVSWNLLVLGLLLTAYKAALMHIYYPADILVTAFVTRLAMGFFDRKKLLNGTNLFVILFSLIIWHLGVLMFLGYGALGVLFAVCGYLKRLENDGDPQKYLPGVLIFTVIIDLIFQNIVWDKAINFIDTFSVISVLLVYYFITFDMKIVSIKNKLAKDIVLLVSRNSLFIYVLHVAAFITLSKLLNIAIQ